MEKNSRMGGNFTGVKQGKKVALKEGTTEKRFERWRFSSYRKTANTWRGFRNRPTTRADRIRPITTGPTYIPVVRKPAAGQGLWNPGIRGWNARVSKLSNSPRLAPFSQPFPPLCDSIQHILSDSYGKARYKSMIRISIKLWNVVLGRKIANVSIERYTMKFTISVIKVDYPEGIN